MPTSLGSQEQQENFTKTSTFVSLTTLKPFTVFSSTNCGKFLKRWDLRSGLDQTTLPALTTRSSYLYAGQEATLRIKYGTMRLVQNWERGMSRLYTVTLLI